MHTMKKSLEIKAPVERVFQFVTTPTNLPSVWPNMVEVSNVEVRAGGWHRFDWVYKMAGLKFHGHAEPKKVETNKYLEMRNDSGIPSTFRWTYEAKGSSSTLVTVEVEYDIPTPLVGKLAESILLKFNERDFDALMHNLKTVLEPSVSTQPQPNGRAHL